MTITSLSGLSNPSSLNVGLSNNTAASTTRATEASASPTSGKISTASEPSIVDVQQATKEVEKIVQSMANNLQFSVDQDSGRTIVKLTDSQTGETIRQIPSTEMLELARDIERFQGLLLKQTA